MEVDLEWEDVDFVEDKEDDEDVRQVMMDLSGFDSDGGVGRCIFVGRSRVSTGKRNDLRGCD